MIPSKVRLRHDEKLKDRFAGEFFFFQLQRQLGKGLKLKEQ